MLFKNRISEGVKIETGYHSEHVLGNNYLIYLTCLLSEKIVLYSKHNNITFVFSTTRDVH